MGKSSCSSDASKRYPLSGRVQVIKIHLQSTRLKQWSLASSACTGRDAARAHHARRCAAQLAPMMNDCARALCASFRFSAAFLSATFSSLVSGMCITAVRDVHGKSLADPCDTQCLPLARCLSQLAFVFVSRSTRTVIYSCFACLLSGLRHPQVLPLRFVQ